VRIAGIVGLAGILALAVLAVAVLLAVIVGVLGTRGGSRGASVDTAPVADDRGPRVRVASLRRRRDAWPGGLRAWLGPLGILLLAAAYITLQWSTIPARFPVHWNGDGQPNGWADRSLAGVLQFTFTGLGIYLVLVLSQWQIERAGRGPAALRAYISRVLLAGAYGMALVFGGLQIVLPLGKVGPGPTAFAIVSLVTLFVAASLGFGWRLRSRAASSREAPAGRATRGRWVGGFVYFDREDPAVFVPKRLGIGYTLNFARASAWVFLGAVLLVPVLTLWIAHR
jgi:uncharacterized membrane protein